MSFSSVENRFIIHGYSSSDASALLDRLAYLYNDSSTFRGWVDGWLTNNVGQNIDLVAPSVFASYTPTPGNLYFELARDPYPDAMHITNDGVGAEAHPDLGLIALFASEVADLSFVVSASDYTSDIGRGINAVFSEIGNGAFEILGWPAIDVFGDRAGIVDGRSYSFGNEIDMAMAVSFVQDTTGLGNSRDVLLLNQGFDGTAASGGGDDYIWHGETDAVIDGGDGIDTLVLEGLAKDWDWRFQPDGTWNLSHVRGAANQGEVTAIGIDQVHMLGSGKTYALEQNGMTHQTDIQFIVDTSHSMKGNDAIVSGQMVRDIARKVMEQNGGSQDVRFAASYTAEIWERDETPEEPLGYERPLDTFNVSRDFGEMVDFEARFNQMMGDISGFLEETEDREEDEREKPPESGPVWEPIFELISQVDWRPSAGSRSVVLVTDAFPDDASFASAATALANSLGPTASYIDGWSGTIGGSGLPGPDTVEIPVHNITVEIPPSNQATGDTQQPEPITVGIYIVPVGQLNGPGASNSNNDGPADQADTHLSNNDAGKLLGQTYGDWIGDETYSEFIANELVTIISQGGLRPSDNTSGGDDVDFGSSGNDFQNGMDGDDELSGLAGDDLLEGGAGADTLRGGEGNDTIRGGGGDDLLVAGPGNDEVDGGRGEDTLAIVDVVEDEVDYPADADVEFELSEDGDLIITSPLGEITARNIEWVARADGLLIPAAGDDVDGTSGNDTITGSLSIDTLTGGLGDDLIDGLIGEDVAVFGGDFDRYTLDRPSEGAAILTGPDGNDTIESIEWLHFDDRAVDIGGIIGARTSSPRTNDIEMFGTDRGDFLVDGDGATAIYGQGGHDIIRAGGGDDTITLVDLEALEVDGGDGIDTLIIAEGALPYATEPMTWDFDLGQVRNELGTVLLEVQGIENVIFRGPQTWEIVGTADGQRIETGSGLDTIDGGPGDDTIASFGGYNIITPGTGNDVVGVSGEFYDTFNGGDDRASGGSGNDILFGVDGTDTLSGGSGNDLIFGGTDASELRGGSGLDRIIGGPGDDTIIGGEDADSLEGGDGNDFIQAHGLIVGGSYDVISPGLGIDTIDAHGPDMIRGTLEELDGDHLERFNIGMTIGIGEPFSEFDTTIPQPVSFDFVDVGTTSAQELRIDMGDDGSVDAVLHIARSDQLLAAQGISVSSVGGLTILKGEDVPGLVLAHGSGNQEINGTAGADTLSGGQGNDTLIGFAGDDLLNGGDTAFPSNEDGADSFVGGDGRDTVTYDGALNSLRVDLRDASLNEGAAEGDRYQSIENVVGSPGADTIGGNSFINELQGKAGNDLLMGYAQDDTLIGGAGSDTLVGGNGEDRLDGGAGFDYASYADATNGVEIHLGDASNNSGDGEGDFFVSVEGVIGSDHDDVLVTSLVSGAADGGPGDDLLQGLNGNDTLTGGLGDDTIRGGDGQDRAVFAINSNEVTATAGASSLVLSSPLGDDLIGDDVELFVFNDATLTYAQASTLVSTGPVVIEGNGDDNTLTGTVVNETILGRGGADTIRAGAGDDTVDGGNGADEVYLGAGSDLFGDKSDGANGPDSVFGLGGADTIYGGGGADDLRGNFGADSLEGGNGADALFGGNGGDTIRSGGGADTVHGGDGRDLAFLGAGDDRFVDTAQGDVVGRDTVHGLNGDDTVLGSGGNDEIYGNSGKDSLEGGTGADTIYGGIGADTIRSGNGTDTVYGGDGRDLTYLGGGADRYFDTDQEGVNGQDTVFGLNGADRIVTRGGDDELYGNAGNDTLLGGAGADTLLGGAGDDNLNGGLGADVFVYGSGQDTISDFGIGADVIELDDALWTGTLSAEDVVSSFASVQGVRIVFDFGGGNTLTLENMNTLAGLADDLVIV
ncbi:calcium-binding protein [Pseudaestuariivita sp.]|uniref:calcium-binding protein n=1 Tax=Pseudaestuariivita sp. TaxID=2211669 RepID=UPI004059F4EF